MRIIRCRGKGLDLGKPKYPGSNSSKAEGDNWPGGGLTDVDYCLKARVETDLEEDQST